AATPDDHLRAASGYGFINKTGQMVIPAQWDDAGEFSQGLAPVLRGSASGFIDTAGKVVIPLKFQSTDSFSDGLAPAASGGKWGYVDRSGAWVIEPQYAGFVPNAIADETFGLGVGRFQGGLAPVYLKGGVLVDGASCSYIDKTGKVVFNRVFERAGDFSEGLAPVQIDGKWGFIDASGTMVIKPNFEQHQSFSLEQYLLGDAGFHEGLAPVALNGKVGYIDKAGKFVIEPQFASGQGFSEGFAYVLTEATSSEYENEPGTVLIQVNGRLAVINISGQLVYEVSEHSADRP
ncbi:MAG: WG repeat-containing protein, partial [Chloroflexi bacterium]|nr:WG repeat-containing protein [Chloroflexota bacterium]